MPGFHYFFYHFYFTLLGSSSWHLCFEYYLWPKVLIFQYEIQEGNWQNQSVMSCYTLFLNTYLSISSSCGDVNIIHGFNSWPDRHTKFKWPMSTLKQRILVLRSSMVSFSYFLFSSGDWPGGQSFCLQSWVNISIWATYLSSLCSHSLLPVVQATSKGVEPAVICHGIYTHRRAIPLPMVKCRTLADSPQLLLCSRLEAGEW